MSINFKIINLQFQTTITAKLFQFALQHTNGLIQTLVRQNLVNEQNLLEQFFLLKFRINIKAIINLLCEINP